MDGGNYPEDKDDFVNAPYANFKDDKLQFDTKIVDNANENYGSVSGFSLKSLLSMAGGIRKGAPRLSSVCRSYPAAKHPPDLVDRFLQHCVFLVVECSRLFHEPDKKSQDVELHAGTLKCADFACAFSIPG